MLLSCKGGLQSECGVGSIRAAFFRILVGGLGACFAGFLLALRLDGCGIPGYACFFLRPVFLFVLDFELAFVLGVLRISLPAAATALPASAAQSNRHFGHRREVRLGEDVIHCKTA